ncbi:hypothetical protein V1477_010776 [Vespula maculifrons]|uniref:Uncharacterized protein n=1 Tax=Vespula maculifrons TaxID=7453 RepID=A0ABD2C2X1_VESMC
MANYYHPARQGVTVELNFVGFICTEHVATTRLLVPSPAIEKNRRKQKKRRGEPSRQISCLKQQRYTIWSLFKCSLKKGRYRDGDPMPVVSNDELNGSSNERRGQGRSDHYSGLYSMHAIHLLRTSDENEYPTPTQGGGGGGGGELGRASCGHGRTRKDLACGENKKKRKRNKQEEEEEEEEDEARSGILKEARKDGSYTSFLDIAKGHRKYLSAVARNINILFRTSRYHMRKRVENIEENMPDTYTPNVSVDRGESSSSVTATSVAWKDGDWPSAKSVNQERLISVSPGDHEVPFLRLTAGGKALLRTIFTISGPPASSCPRLLARRHCERIDFLWSQCRRQQQRRRRQRRRRQQRRRPRRRSGGGDGGGGYKQKESSNLWTRIYVLCPPLDAFLHLLVQENRALLVVLT